METRGLASDNFAGAHPKVMEALLAVNRGHAMAYGEDAATARVRRAFDVLFGRPVTTHFVFNGTAANVLALSAFAKPHGAVLCAEPAHVWNDESTAPERTLGMRLVPLASRDGKLRPEALEAALGLSHGVHGVHPVALTLTQPTELGTLYTLDEMATLVGLARAAGLGVHVDGARLGCAAAALGDDLPLRLADLGVDALSFGGTKQGMVFGEAVVFLREGLGGDFPYWQKASMQLASKMRFVSAQFEALLEGGLWIANGRHACAMARKLEEALRDLPDVATVYPVEANAVFARIPPSCVAPLQAKRFFWPWDEREGLVRWMCAWDTEAEDLHSFVALVRETLEGFRGC